ncbi:phage holin family protein [Pseudomonas indica]|uniref:Putative 3TM holin, Phage_holin_3 n=1 Tax=Pseudomonas indica TaxID=137658 RepID=A0A1G8V623_9PSED|nr:phage holin family protein [Pseudomonas indica]SDJ60775.1 Putative 3TM holin, Phage_holin_3 [Pseudomonas indica]
MVSLILTQLVFWLCAVLFVRLFTYRRDGARFRRGMSVAAVVVMGCAGSAMIEILQGRLHIPAPAWPLVVLLAVFAWSVWRASGNLAGVLRPEPQPWDGVDRRRQGIGR